MIHYDSYMSDSEAALSNDLYEYIQYCDAITDLIKRYEIVEFDQVKNESKKSELEKEKYEIESGGGKAFSIKGNIYIYNRHRVELDI